MTSVSRIKPYGRRGRVLLDTRHFGLALTATANLLMPHRWIFQRVYRGCAIAVPLTRKTHLIIGVSL